MNTLMGDSMYKYKVLVVDDEHNIRERVVNKMPWADIGSKNILTKIMMN
ncbi:hypothetical protein J2Z66_000478 [Paenibacillus eucommiae]|uniref:Response regulatory domain-containing protein n=1 Tax=Paenibacillus eucommiae TaxID=1355755 RepID=A0ABS4IMS9_9BACL|nr:hypothetical protein [Paenibacillus eucommiae]